MIFVLENTETHAAHIQCEVLGKKNKDHTVFEEIICLCNCKLDLVSLTYYLSESVRGSEEVSTVIFIVVFRANKLVIKISFQYLYFHQLCFYFFVT